jgi:hypothetical protein
MLNVLRKERLENICQTSKINGAETEVTISKEDFLWFVHQTEKFNEYEKLTEIAENRMVEIDEEKNEKISLLEKEILELYREIKELKGQIEVHKDGSYERTRKDKVRDQYHAIRNRYPNFNKFDEGVLAGMSDTLYLLGIKIKGVNN